MHNTYTKIVAATHKFFQQTGAQRAVIGVSGGIDSSLCLKLVVDAIGKDKVTAISMPEKGVSTDENLMHARELCKFLGVEYFNVSINKYLTDYTSLPWKPNDLSTINTKARIRMTLLYNYANSRNAIVIGTSNKTELAIGYGTKYGDMASDIDIIGDLLKGDVYKLAEHVGLPDEIIKKAPSAELYPEQTDEEELGMTYREIDMVIQQMEQGQSKDDLISKGLTPNVVHKVFRLVDLNKHKLIPPHIITL